MYTAVFPSHAMYSPIIYVSETQLLNVIINLLVGFLQKGSSISLSQQEG